jgi:hypothetical protein
LCIGALIDNPDKLMAQHTLETSVSINDFQIGGTYPG